jgi:hypothetical protein
MQHNEVEEEAFVAPDTQGDADSPFVAASAFGGYQAKRKKRSTHGTRRRNHEPTLVSHTEPADVIEVEGALFIIAARCGEGRWAHTWLIPDDGIPLTIDAYAYGQDHRTGPFYIPGDFAIGKVLMLRPLAWR